MLQENSMQLGFHELNIFILENVDVVAQTLTTKRHRLCLHLKQNIGRYMLSAGSAKGLTDADGFTGGCFDMVLELSSGAALVPSAKRSSVLP